jgi:hypothetical protein
MVPYGRTIYLRFHVVESVVVQIKVFWLVTLCSSVSNSNISREHTASIFRVEERRQYINDSDEKHTLCVGKNQILQVLYLANTVQRTSSKCSW